MVMREQMKYWTFITLLLISGSAFAQKSATAVMNVSVTVISGSTISDVQNVNIDFDNQVVTSGGFEIQTSQNIDTAIENDGLVTLTNQFGESITIESDSSLISQNNTQRVNVSAKLDDSIANLRGAYQGTMTTTIAYF